VRLCAASVRLFNSAYVCCKCAHACLLTSLRLSAGNMHLSINKTAPV
jgi:hypothetical protein